MCTVRLVFLMLFGSVEGIHVSEECFSFLGELLKEFMCKKCVSHFLRNF